MKTLRFIFGVLVLLNLIPIVHAQKPPQPYLQQLYRKDGNVASMNLGASVAGNRWIDGDYYTDFVVGGPSLSGGTVESVFVYSGTTGNVLHRVGLEGSSNFGTSVTLTIGDVDGIGWSDFLVGAPFYGKDDRGAAFVYSGTSGSLLCSIEGTQPQTGIQGGHLGAAIAPAGLAVGGDNIADFIIGSPLFSAPYSPMFGRATVFSGATCGSTLNWYGYSNGDQFGSAVSAADLNGDGVVDYIVGAPFHDTLSMENVGKVYVFSGTGGNLYLPIYGTAANTLFGFSVAVIGDINQDYKPDFIVGAPGAASGKGRAYVYDGATGQRLFQTMTFEGAAVSDSFGYAMGPAGSTGMGGLDFLVGAPYANPSNKTDAGSAYLYSGYDGSLIKRLDGATAGDHFGWSVNECGDIKPTDAGYEQVDAFIIGAPHTDYGGTNAGSAYVYRYRIPSLPKISAGNLATTFNLEQNYPNPFNANTNISFSLDAPARVKLVVYNILGEKVRTLLSEDRSAGSHEVAFDGRDEKGNSLSSGVYFYKLNAGERIVTKQMMLIK